MVEADLQRVSTGRHSINNAYRSGHRRRWFTGKYVVNALTRRGYRVIGVGLGPPAGGDWVACDLTNKA